jgi:protein-S-isoprenylcysteine O-methyltransferase Ste14
VLLSTAGFVLVLGLVTFLPAGISWRSGGLFLLIFLTCMAASVAYLWRANPDIFLARSRIGKGTKLWDKVLMVPLLVSFFGIFAVAGFDARYGWSTVPLWLMVLGYVLFVFGYVMSTWVYAVNKFAEPSVRIQAERGHTVIETGPYGLVRHPLYLFSAFLVGGIPFALGSYWALIPVGVGALAIVVRTSLEDRLLRNELAGYKDYAARVRFRLIPGLW